MKYDPSTIMVAIGVLCLTFWSGMEFKEYQVRSELCKPIGQLSRDLFKRELSPASPCAPYV